MRDVYTASLNLPVVWLLTPTMRPWLSKAPPPLLPLSNFSVDSMKPLTFRFSGPESENCSLSRSRDGHPKAEMVSCDVLSASASPSGRPAGSPLITVNGSALAGCLKIPV
eukprot:1840145-Prymnesium_polylepis.1